METKRIQLRGISRTPSDRMTSDGGVAESLNVHLDNEEIAPVIEPEDITSDLVPEGLIGRPIYLHTTSSYKNVISIKDNVVYSNGKAFASLGDRESVSDIAHIGNTLIISTNEMMYYFIFKGVIYTTLGGSIPFPTMDIIPSDLKRNSISFEYEEETTSQPNQDYMLNTTTWNAYDENGANTLGIAKDVSNRLYEEFNSKKKDTHYSWPIVARYALRLYDGSMITSVPILVSPENIRGLTSASAEYSYIEPYPVDNGTAPGADKITINALVQNYKPYAKLLDYQREMEEWSDIVKGIDIYFSEEIIPETINCVGVNLLESGYDYAKVDIFLGGTEYNETEQILEQSVFFKVASYDFSRPSDVEKLQSGVDFDYIKSEELLVKESLDPFKDIMESGQVIPQTLSTFNNRLVAGNIINKISSGPRYMTSSDGIATGEEWCFRWYLEVNGEKLHVLRKYVGDVSFYTSLTPFAWLSYPDIHCVRVEVATRSGMYLSIPMKEHPRLNCSYAYLGPKPLIDYMVYDEEMAGTVAEKDDKDSYMINNKIYLSEIDNPIIFPIANRYTIGSGKIVGMAVATQALSQGQFGKFPLYVFTTDGIWTMGTNDVGTFSTITPLSKEICSNPKSILPLEQEVVFNTKKGVMLLSGSEVVELSPNMNGKHYTIEPTAKVLAKSQPGFSSLVDISSDPTPFTAFIDGAKTSYDYTGKRIILINPDEEFQYIYKFGTKTWHKFCREEYVIVDSLNSYPECYVVAQDDSGSYRILNLSTVLDSTKEQATKVGIIATRPFDLDMPDVFKTITDVRVRGQYRKGSVTFILLGSDDGINFYVINTLRGKAWKLFRIIVLSKLDMYERISWIDVQYETKFTNRLR